MSEFTDKLDAAGNNIASRTKEAISKATDNKLVAEGTAKKLKGTVRDVTG